jgi:amino acid adenylation domain-containing protein
LSKIGLETPRGPATSNGAGSRVFPCLEHLLTFYALTAPDRDAILAPGCTAVTYQELSDVTKQAVRKMRKLGVSHRDRVAVVLPRGPECALAVIAVATAAICVPINPDFTADELQRYFSDLQIAVLVMRADTESPSRGVAHTLGIPVIDWVSGKRLRAFDLVGPAMRRAIESNDYAGGSDDAFILLTSGTTSRPKMVPITHASVCLSAYNAGVTLALGPQDRLLNVLPLFHAHGLISGLLTALAAGSSVICAPSFDAAAFFGWLRQMRPTWYTAVPTIHRALLSEAHRDKKAHNQPTSLRLIRSASASLPRDVLADLESLFGVPVIETYGMTEAASQIAANPLERRKPGSVGRAAGADIAIMDLRGQTLPVGERGEIVLRGPTIFRGYDNNVTATESAFRNGWFRTGDLGLLDSQGYLFIVGRIKDVINRGGQQVSPVEVEEALLRHPDVLEAGAFATAHKTLGENVAAVVVLRPNSTISTHSLRAFTRKRLAAYKVPGLIRIVPEIPKGASGKIRRDLLAETLKTLEAERHDRDPPPSSKLEAQLSSMWAHLLELNHIRVDEDIFALGADSLTVMQMLSRLRARFKVDLSFQDLFDAPTVAMLAARIASSTPRDAVAPNSLRETESETDGYGSLSLQQQRIYVLSRLDQIGHKYHVINIVHLSGRLDLDALEASIAAVCERHEALRSIFLERRGEPMQAVTRVQPVLTHIDLRTLPGLKTETAVQSLARELLLRPFDSEKEPPIRLQLLKLGEDHHALMIALHHLITDGRSQRLFWDELAQLYNAKSRGVAAKLVELPVQYRHFVQWQRSWLKTPAAKGQLRYWLRRLEGLTELPLPTDRPRPTTWTGRGARYPLKLSPALCRRIRSLSGTHNVTLFMTLLAAFQCLLFRYTQHDDIAVGSLIANRNLIETEQLIGMFANAIVLRTDLSGAPTFAELLRRVRQATLAAYEHQDLPIEDILQALQVPRNLDQNPLFRVMFILQKASSTCLTLNGLSARPLDLDPRVARSDLLLELVDADGCLNGWLEYSTDLFEEATIARMAAHFRKLLESIVASPDERLACLSLLPERERKTVLVDFNHTPAERSSRPESFSEKFIRQVKRTPNAIALSIGSVRMSYFELARRAFAIADRLGRLPTDAVVVLYAERGVELLAAMIAVQRAGGAFLPLDPTTPASRLAEIIQHSGARMALATQGCAAHLKLGLAGLRGSDRPRILILEKLYSGSHCGGGAARDRASAKLACVLYTSGSTGVPKGAMIERRGLVNHLLSKISDLNLSASDVVAQTAPQSFVISIWQFLAPLMVGARVHICSDDEMRDPALLMAAMLREKITVLEIVPSLLREILQPAPSASALSALSQLRSVISTGESLAPDLCRRWFQYCGDVPLINAYGATECSDDVATNRLTSSPSSVATVPIGRPIANVQLYVLDEQLQPVPIGIVGELHVGGISVGRGYLNDREQTRRSFLRDKFSKARSARLYRTGDLARWRADGMLECLGRTDRQVKMRGFRIAPEEIEHILMEHAGVQSAVVVARDNRHGEMQLVGYLVAENGRQPTVNQLRDYLKSRLPAHMIPAAYAYVERMPLTAHGKLDRAALAARGPVADVAGAPFVAPRSPTEVRLAAIWAALLDVKEISVFDDFFDLGGHSLLAGRVLARVADVFGVSLPIRALFEANTIEVLAQRIDEAAKTEAHKPAIRMARLEVRGPRSVSIAQDQMMKTERELPGLPQFNLPFAFRLEGPLNLRALKESLLEVVRRHESLRTGFRWMKGRPLAHITPPEDVDDPLVLQDMLTGKATNSRIKSLQLKNATLLGEQEGWIAFDMARAPLLRTRLLRLAARDHVLLITVHHMVADGWSVGVLFEEISKLYSVFTGGLSAPLPLPELQFSDFARWERWWCTTDAAAQQLGYWRENLQEAKPVFQTASDAAQAPVSLRIAHEPVDLPEDLVTRLSSFGRTHGGSLFMTLLTALKVLLLARTGRRDICVATAMANRSRPGTDRMIGQFENTTIIRTSMDPDLPFREAFGCVRNVVLDAHARQELPFDIVVERLSKEDGFDPASLVQVYFTLQNPLHQSLELQNIAVHSFGNVYRDGQPVLPIDHTWLSLMLKERSSGITGSCNYKSSLFEHGAITRWMGDFTTILANALANPEAPLGRLLDQQNE